MDTGIYFYHTINQDVKTCLVVPTSRSLHVVMITGRGLVERTRPLDDEQFMRPAMPLKEGLSRLGGVARRKGSTKAARTWIDKARESMS